MYYLIILIQSLLTFFLLKKFIKLSHKINNYGESNNHLTRNENVPTSGGIIVFLVYLISIFLYFLFFKETFLELAPNKYYVVIFSMTTLFVMSAYDDFKTIHPIYKLILQIVLVYISTTALNLSEVKLPLKLSLLIIVILWVYTVNIVNFIDGSDGFLTSYSLFFFISIIVESFINLNFSSFSTILSTLIIPILIIFLYFNKPRAKVFLGDSGSIFLGFLIGFISLNWILSYNWRLSLILLMYPLLDCTITLALKIKRGYYPWARLFDYFFLGPIKKNNDHIFVFKIIIYYYLLNFIIFIGQIFFINSNIFLILSFMLTMLTLFYFKKNS